MRVVILTDEFFASRERTMLERLEVGLADEGVRIIHATPEAAHASPEGSLFMKSVTFTPRPLSITRGLAVSRLARTIESQDENEEAPDIVHVFGGSMWQFGQELAEELGSALALEVWRAGLVSRARDVRLEEGRPLLFAPDESIQRALSDAASHATVRLAAWGVHAPAATDSPRAVFPEHRAPSAMIVGSGRDVPAFSAALTGLAEVARARQDFLIFCDAHAARRADLWPLARRLGILNHMTLIDELEGRRDLLLQGDLLIQPDAHGESRSTVLEAMAGGLIVIAAADPFVTVLQDGVTARLVPSGDARAWGRVLQEVLGDPERTRALAASALAYVRQHRRASDQVRAVLSGYQWLVSEEPRPPS